VAREALAAAFDPLISPRSGAGHRCENNQRLRDGRTYADRNPTMVSTVMARSPLHLIARRDLIHDATATVGGHRDRVIRPMPFAVLSCYNFVFTLFDLPLSIPFQVAP
jgi:hypothetical protein